MRIKVQIWSEALQRWKTVYIQSALLHANLMLLRSYGFKFRVKDTP